MTTDISNPDQALKQKYFLVSKRGTVIFVFLSLLAYGAAVLWSEFVFSVSSPDGAKQVEYKKITSKIRCASTEEAKKYEVQKQQIPKRNPWLFETNFIDGTYSDFITSFPECQSASILYAGIDPRGSIIYFFNRSTNKPTVKVTIESIN